MNSPVSAVAWEIWQRGRRSAWFVLGCTSLCAFINLVILGHFYTTETSRAVFYPFFRLLMILSFLLLMGVFNYTEFNATKEWNGFPYRLFVLPLRTWQLVTLPMLFSVAAVELVYFAWIKLVWTHEQIMMPGWFAVVFGAYMIFYQSGLWILAGLRIMRLIALGSGGASCIAVACLPMFGYQISSPWLSEKRLIAMVTGAALVAFVMAWASVARQRCGGGRRRSLIKTGFDQIMDRVPRRARDFPSSTAAQFWFEWRRSGILLPACTAFVLIVIVGPLSGFFRTDPQFTVKTLFKILCLPVVLAFAIGKGFIKPDFWSNSLSVPTFLAIRPFPTGEFVIVKMKVAVVSVVLTWLVAIGLVTLWLALWADTTNLKQLLFMFRALYPHSWLIIILLSPPLFMTVTWRVMVSGLWTGLSGKRFYYIGSLGVQVILPSLVLLAFGIWSAALDVEIKKHPDRVIFVALTSIGWALALAVICKLWLTVFSWNKITVQHTRRYMLIWLAVTSGLVGLSILFTPPFDTYRVEHLLVLAAFLLFPLARLGLAPLFLTRNRHR